MVRVEAGEGGEEVGVTRDGVSDGHSSPESHDSNDDSDMIGPPLPPGYSVSLIECVLWNWNMHYHYAVEFTECVHACMLDVCLQCLLLCCTGCQRVWRYRQRRRGGGGGGRR